MASAAEQVDAVLASKGPSDDAPYLAFAIRPQGGAEGPVEILAKVRRAIGRSNEIAVARHPGDPTWCTDGDLVGDEIWAELAKGTFHESEVRAWFADLLTELRPDAFDVLPREGRARDSRLPDFDAWRASPPSATAYLYFVPDMMARRRSTPRQVVDNTADALAAWCMLPRATCVISRGLSTFTVEPDQAAHELRLSAALEQGHSLAAYREDPLAGRLVSFSRKAKGALQVIDGSRSPAQAASELLAPLRLLAPYLTYANVRCGLTTSPSDQDIGHVLGRAPTEVEEGAASRPQLLNEHVIDAAGIQILTSAHLSRLGTLRSFDVEELGQDRFLVTAHDLGPWFAGFGPPQEQLQQARYEFGEALLTQVLIDHA